MHLVKLRVTVRVAPKDYVTAIAAMSCHGCNAMPACNIIFVISCRCVSNLIDVELLNQVQISAFSTQVSLGHRLHALFLQTIHHIIEGILVRQCCKRLQKQK